MSGNPSENLGPKAWDYGPKNTEFGAKKRDISGGRNWGHTSRCHCRHMKGWFLEGWPKSKARSRPNNIWQLTTGALLRPWYKNWCVQSMVEVVYLGNKNSTKTSTKTKNCHPSYANVSIEHSEVCISPIFASRDVSKRQNSYRGHISHAHIVSTHRWIANITVSLVTVGDLGNVTWFDCWRNCVHDQ
jgi:hypothetical protein